jgi:two-component system, NtrC family, nitrogen regulation sensor histidine kinase NtrY
LTGSFKQAFYTRRYLLITAAWLFIISFLFSAFFSYRTSIKRATTRIEDHLQQGQKDFHELIKDTASLYALNSGSYSKADQASVYNQPFSFFLYTRNDVGNVILNFWNTHAVEPLPGDINGPDGSKLVQYANGFFVLEKHTIRIRNSRVLAVALYPVKWKYFLENKYLKSEFQGFKGLGQLYDISPKLSSHIVKDIHDKPVFSLVKLENRNLPEFDNFSIILWILGTLCLFLYINSVSNTIFQGSGLKKAAGFLLTFLILYRLLTIYIPFPFSFKKLELFDASVYASSVLFPSLGDLLLNALLVFWFVIFLKTHFLKRQNLSFHVKPTQVWVINGIVSMTFVLSAFFLADIVKSLVAESTISFDVTDFFSLNVYTVISFLVLTILLITFYHGTSLLFHLLRLIPPVEGIYRLLGTGIIGILVLIFSPFDTANSVNVIVLVWLLIYIFIIQKRERDWGRPIIRSSLFIFWLMFFAFSVTAILIYQNTETEKQKRRSIAEKLAMQTDPSGENLMGISMTSLEDNWLADNYHRFEVENNNRFLKDSLTTENFAGYLNKFDTQIYTYDSLFHPLYNDDSTTSYADIKSLIITQGKSTQTEGLYYYENTFDRFSYLFEKQVKGRSGNTLGYIFIIAKPKRYKSEALYPELFNQVSDISTDLNTNYAYAVYSNGKLINSFNDFNFSRQLTPAQVPLFEVQWKEGNGRSELWYKAGKDKVVVVVKKEVFALEAVTLFAYFFFSFLFIVLLFHAGRYLLNTNFEWKKIWDTASLSIRNQIHLTIIFISLFSFIIIGVATISFFVIRFNKANAERLGRTSQVMVNEIEAKINAIKVSDDNISIYDLGLKSELDKTLAEVSDIHNVDVNFFDKQGELRLSTIPYLYSKGIVNRRMDPVAYFEMTNNKRAEWLQKETVANFSYLSIYVPIKNENQETFAYLNVPYLNSQRELNEEISNFLVTLINLNAFIFLLAGAIAFFLANKITSSFSLISAKMREVNLGTINEEIHWKNRDEIGALVYEYNKMVKKLEASANALARSEREGAWREMARQVAHEIKNPLTPMKLSIQHLQRAIDSGSPNVKELSQRMASTLIEQIDQLSKIAADFSQFANIGNIKPEVVNVEQVLQSLIGLYSSDGKLALHFHSDIQQPKIFADKTQVNRLFTNLIKNAIEASSENDVIQIHVSIKKDADNILIAVRDEGSGIPAEMQQKIFSPNFTTKSSGTGLGLAICKAIVEKANGTIWFETEEAKGTTFFVLFPELSKE